MVSIFSTLQIVNFGEMIMAINTTRAKTLIIAIITITIAVSHRKESVIFVVKKVVILISI